MDKDEKNIILKEVERKEASPTDINIETVVIEDPVAKEIKLPPKIVMIG